MPKLVDGENDEKVGSEKKEEEKIIPVPVPVPVGAKAKAVEPEKLSMTPEELDALVAKAVADNQAAQEEKIRKEEAERQGNYKVLFEDAEKARYKAERHLWVNQALTKYKLTFTLFDAVTGNTEDEIMKSAKKLHESIEAEIEARKLVLEGQVITPDGGRNKPQQPKPKLTGDESTRYTIARALGLGRVQH